MKERAYKKFQDGKAAELTRRPNKNCYMTVDDTLQSGEENKELSLFTADTVQSNHTPGSA